MLLAHGQSLPDLYQRISLDTRLLREAEVEEAWGGLGELGIRRLALGVGDVVMNDCAEPTSFLTLQSQWPEHVIHALQSCVARFLKQSQYPLWLW
jgi:hypothetical protein